MWPPKWDLHSAGATAARSPRAPTRSLTTPSSTPHPPGRSDPRGPLCVRLSGSSVPFSGEPAEFGSSRRALPPPFPGSKQRRTCQAPLGSQEGLASRCSGHFWRRSRIAQVRYGSSLNAAADFCVSPGSLPPSPVNVTLQQLGRGGGSVGARRGRMPGFDSSGRSRESPKQRTAKVCLSLIYADEPVVFLIPQAHLSLVPAVVG